MAKAKTNVKSLSGKNPHTPADLFPEGKRTILTEKKLDSILQVSRGKVKVKAVASPFAQTVIQCAGITERGWSYESLQARFKQIGQYDSKVAAIFDLQFAGGCRISEVLAISYTDIDSLGRVTIRGLKGGETRVISSSFSAQFLLRQVALKANPFVGLDRFYVYRVYKRYGVSEYYGENKRASVTHLPRHEVALASKKIARDESTTKSQLGQKSVKSTAHYTGKARAKKGK